MLPPPAPPPAFISAHSISLLLSLTVSLLLLLRTFNMCRQRRLLRCLSEGGSFLRGREAGWVGVVERRRSFQGRGVFNSNKKM